MLVHLFIVSNKYYKNAFFFNLLGILVVFLKCIICVDWSQPHCEMSVECFSLGRLTQPFSHFNLGCRLDQLPAGSPQPVFIHSSSDIDNLSPPHTAHPLASGSDT